MTEEAAEYGQIEKKQEQSEGDVLVAGKTEEEWVSLARDAFLESDTFMESGLRDRWMRNYSLSQSEHPAGSKYLTEGFKHRSKSFRGKTEASVRKNEAALTIALFTNREIVSIEPVNQSDENAVIAADSIKLLTNARLAEKKMGWAKTVIGAYREAMVTGNVFSEQYWEYEKDENGNVEIDRPRIKLYPLEHVHISPSADWDDIIGTTPYIIIDIPMYVGDIKERMDSGEWFFADESAIKTATNPSSSAQNSVQRTRQGNEQIVPEDQPSAITDFTIAYVHKVCIRVNGNDYFYFTLGNTSLLSPPVPLADIYPHIKKGDRPFTWGTATIEPHKVYNRSMVERVVHTQNQINELTNQRFDNVRQVLNKRKYAKRGAGVDYSTLVKNITGSVVLMDDINAVKEEPVTDITSSSYHEQNLLNVDHDDLSGAFSTSSVASNRSLNETVGGMQMLQGSANILSEYQMRIFVETWVEPVIEQVARMCQFYEDDSVIAAVVGPGVISDDLQAPVKITADVGFGATDPQRKVSNLVFGIRTVQELFPEVGGRLNGEAIIKEVFGAIGFNDGSKFFNHNDEEIQPQVKELMQTVQQLHEVLKTDRIKAQQAIEVEQLKAKNRFSELILKLQAERQIKLTELALKQNISVKELEAKTGQNSDKLNLELIKEANRRLDIMGRQKELTFKMRTGEQGI